MFTQGWINGLRKWHETHWGQSYFYLVAPDPRLGGSMSLSKLAGISKKELERISWCATSDKAADLMQQKLDELLGEA